MTNKNQLNIDKFKKNLYITRYAYDKFQAYIDNCQYELGGLGTIEIEKDDYIITDILLTKQESSSTKFKIDSKQIQDMFTSYLNEKKDPYLLKVFWHSHVNMGVFWSGEDEEQYDDFIENDVDFMISIVGNKKGEILARIDYFTPMRIGINNVPIKILKHDSIDEDVITKEINEKVSRFKFNNKPINPIGFNNTNSIFNNRKNNKNNKNKPNKPSYNSYNDEFELDPETQAIYDRYMGNDPFFVDAGY